MGFVLQTSKLKPGKTRIRWATRSSNWDGFIRCNYHWNMIDLMKRCDQEPWKHFSVNCLQVSSEQAAKPRSKLLALVIVHELNWLPHCFLKINFRIIFLNVKVRMVHYCQQQYYLFIVKSQNPACNLTSSDNDTLLVFNLLPMQNDTSETVVLLKV